MKKLNLYLFYLGYKTPKNNIEQHDICFGVGEQPTDCKQQILREFPDIQNLHVDTYTLIDQVDDYAIHIIPAEQIVDLPAVVMNQDLFFINLGGYKQGEIGELHKQLFLVLPGKTTIQSVVKDLPFFEQSFLENKQALPHVDDTITVEDFISVSKAIPKEYKLIITQNPGLPDYKTKVTITGFWRLTKW